MLPLKFTQPDFLKSIKMPGVLSVVIRDAVDQDMNHRLKKQFRGVTVSPDKDR